MIKIINMFILLFLIGCESNNNSDEKLEKIIIPKEKKLERIHYENNVTKEKINLSLEPLTEVGEFYFKIQQKIDNKLQELVKD